MFVLPWTPPTSRCGSSVTIQDRKAPPNHGAFAHELRFLAMDLGVLSGGFHKFLTFISHFEKRIATITRSQCLQIGLQRFNRAEGCPLSAQRPRLAFWLAGALSERRGRRGRRPPSPPPHPPGMVSAPPPGSPPLPAGSGHCMPSRPDPTLARPKKVRDQFFYFSFHISLCDDHLECGVMVRDPPARIESQERPISDARYRRSLLCVTRTDPQTRRCRSGARAWPAGTRFSRPP